VRARTQLGSLAPSVRSKVQSSATRRSSIWGSAAASAVVTVLRSSARKRTLAVAVDGLRYLRNPPAGELMRGRMTVMGKDPVGDEKGIVIAQHDLLDESGRLVFSCLTRALLTRR